MPSCDAALEELRELARGIHPAVLTEHGLGPALKTLAARSPLPVEIGHVPSSGCRRRSRPPPTSSSPRRWPTSPNTRTPPDASVSIACDGGSLVVEVEDDGVGGAEPRRGSGLAGLADRVHALDGWLTIESAADHGTRLRAELPYAISAER